MRRMILKFFYVFMFAILRMSSALDKNQKDVLIAISKNLEIKHCIVLDEEFGSKNYENNPLPLLKMFTGAKISTAVMSPEKLNSTFPKYENPGEIYQPKTIIFIKTKDLRMVAHYLFRFKNEDFLTKFIWVMFFSQDLDLGELDFLYIPYHTQFLLIYSINSTKFEIEEIYNTQAFTRQRYVTHFGTWQQVGGLKIPITDFCQRRFDMNGSILGIVAPYLPRKCNHPISCQYEKIVVEFSRMMNFRTYYATFQELDELQDKNIDIILEFYLNTFVFDADYFRPHVVGPIWKSPAFLHIKLLNKYLQGKVEPYRRPFTSDLWRSTAAFTLVCTLVMLHIYIKLPADIRKKGYLVDVMFLCLDSISNQSELIVLGNLIESKYFACRLLFASVALLIFNLIWETCNKNKASSSLRMATVNSRQSSKASFIIFPTGGSKPPSTCSSRISLLASRFVPFFLIPAYSAAIVSFITIRHLHLPFNDLGGLVTDGTFKITYQNETIAAIFLEKRNDEAGRKAKEKFLAPIDKMPLSVEEGNNQMCNDSQISYISFNNDVYRLKQKCTILQIPTPIFMTWDAFMVREHSPYIKIFNRMIKTFFSSGVLKKMEKIVYGTKPTYHRESGEDPVELEALTIIFGLLAVAYLLSICIFFTEFLYYKIWEQ